MSLFKKLLSRFGAKPAASPADVVKIALETKAKLEESFFARHYKALRQYRLDAHVRREVLAGKAWGYRTRPRMPQAAAKMKVVPSLSDKHLRIELETGQVLVAGNPWKNPALRKKADALLAKHRAA